MTSWTRKISAALGFSTLLILGQSPSAWAITEPVITGSIGRGTPSSFTLTIKIGGIAEGKQAILSGETDLLTDRIGIKMMDVSTSTVVPYNTASSDVNMTFVATQSGSPLVEKETSGTTYSITYYVKIAEATAGALAAKLKATSNKLGFQVTYSEAKTAVGNSSTTQYVTATAGIAKSAPAGFKPVAGDSKVIFTWTASGTTDFKTSAGTVPGSISGVALVVISSTTGSTSLPAMTFNPDPNVTTDTAAATGTCQFLSGFNDGDACITCTDPALNYLNIDKLSSMTDDGITVKSVASTSSGKEEIGSLEFDKSYTAFMFNLPGGLEQTSCYRVVPYEGRSLAQINGEQKQVDNPRCFVATAAYGSPLHRNIKLFTWFRSHVLLQHPWGRTFVHYYNIYGPPAAQVVANHPTLALAARTVLWAPALAISFWLALTAHSPWAIAGMVAAVMFAAGFVLKARERRI